MCGGRPPHNHTAPSTVIQTFSEFIDAIAHDDGIIDSAHVLPILADHGLTAADYYGDNEPAATPTYALRHFLGY